MSTPDLTAWLRPLVEADRKRWAEQAAHLQGAPHRLAVTFSSEIAGKIAYAEEQIFRCEAELAILDEHYILREGDTNPAYEQYGIISPPFPSKGFGCVTCHYGSQGCVHGYGYCRTVRLLGGGYRHRPGYQEEAWKP